MDEAPTPARFESRDAAVPPGGRMPDRSAHRAGRARRRTWLLTLGVLVVGMLLGTVAATIADHIEAQPSLAAADAAEINPAAVVGRSSTTTSPSAVLPMPTEGIASVAGLPTPTSRNPTSSIDNRVFILGDSVMQGATPYLGDSLAGWSVTADTKVGRFLHEGVGVLTRRRPQIGQVAVILMGNNYDGDAPSFARDLDAAMGELEGVRHVIFLTVTMYEKDRAEVNDALGELAAAHANVTLVDWGAWADEHARTLLGADRLHLTPEGAEELAALVGESVTRVTRAAGERPAPGATSPKLHTNGSIPGSRSSIVPSRRATSSKRTATPTTRVNGQGATSPPTSDPTPATTPLGETTSPPPSSTPSVPVPPSGGGAEGEG